MIVLCEVFIAAHSRDERDQICTQPGNRAVHFRSGPQTRERGRANTRHVLKFLPVVQFPIHCLVYTRQSKDFIENRASRLIFITAITKTLPATRCLPPPNAALRGNLHLSSRLPAPAVPHERRPAPRSHRPLLGRKLGHPHCLVAPHRPCPRIPSV